MNVAGAECGAVDSGVRVSTFSRLCERERRCFWSTERYHVASTGLEVISSVDSRIDCSVDSGVDSSIDSGVDRQQCRQQCRQTEVLTAV